MALNRRFASVAAVCSPAAPTVLAFILRCFRAAEATCLVDGEPEVEVEEVVGAMATAASNALGSRRTNDEVLGELLLGKGLGSGWDCCRDGGGGKECVLSGNRKKLDA